MSPRALRPGDAVALVAPSGPIADDLVDQAVGALTAWGLRVEVFDGVRARHPRYPYLAGTDEQRAADFTRAWTREDIAAVVAARGGYGAQRMIDLIDWDAVRAAGPKPFAGSSDITALHAALARHLGTPTVFATMPASTHFDAAAAESLREALFHPDATRTIRGPSARTLAGGTATGRTVGGNLSLLAASAGTPEQQCAAGGIALLEDVGEDVYRIDRMLTQLLRSGWFDGVAGIALGSWAECGDPADVEALVLERLGSLGVPMVWELGFGHHKGALTLPLGVPATLDADAAHLVINPGRGGGR
ncbi:MULTISPECIES: S66 peptidase family protein [Prauserella salsuginis group]|uniref:LD-carboxypeptidase n=1 Tax=Prauserella salsuginis TaxID=387889 RepID=A0ABW6G4I7_9PSEU|nr:MULTISPECIES: LD-carboxypeptidase [Prauserella salsuginis group]MCR3718134.1 muramoyltetrapeptide carboxypeptidase [Prauserella flava]MCR3732704.1 muramoyltetrapeptide carboxypeptidase [Prauserella salsuginis]